MTSTEEYSHGMSVSSKVTQFVKAVASCSGEGDWSHVNPKPKKKPSGKKRGPYKKRTDYSKNEPKQKAGQTNINDFDANEDRALTVNYLKHSRMLRNHKVSLDMKKAIWDKILMAVNAQGPINRSLARVKKRLSNIKAGCKFENNISFK